MNELTFGRSNRLLKYNQNRRFTTQLESVEGSQCESTGLYFSNNAKTLSLEQPASVCKICIYLYCRLHLLSQRRLALEVWASLNPVLEACHWSKILISEYALSWPACIVTTSHRETTVNVHYCKKNFRWSLSCLVLLNNWHTSSWSITPMGGGGALRHATCDRR